MRRFAKYLIIIVLFIGAPRAALPVLAVSPSDYLSALTDTLMGGHYEEANRISSQIHSEFSGHPLATYSRIAILYSHIIDLEDTSGRAEFLVLVDSCVQQCDSWKGIRPEEPALIAWIKGSALSSRGMILYREGKKLVGLRQLISARGDFDEAMKLDSTFFDALLGRGAYRSAVGRNASLLAWLPLIPSAQEGWQDLQCAATKSRWSRYAALNAMAWFALDDRNFALVDSITSVGLTRFPDSRSFLWPRMAMYERQEMWTETALIAEKLLKQYLDHPDNNGYETTGLYWRLMQCADLLEKPKEADTYAKAGLAAYRTPAAAERRKEKLADMKNWLERSSTNTDMEHKSGE